MSVGRALIVLRGTLEVRDRVIFLLDFCWIVVVGGEQARCRGDLFENLCVTY